MNCTNTRRLQQNYTKVQMRQIGPGVGVSFKSRDSDSDSTSLVKTLEFSPWSYRSELAESRVRTGLSSVYYSSQRRCRGSCIRSRAWHTHSWWFMNSIQYSYSTDKHQPHENAYRYSQLMCLIMLPCLMAEAILSGQR